MSTTPIADYALLSDRHSAALVSRDGSIDWLCFPRFDSPSIFARLLGDEAGHWSVGATGATQVTRRYLDRTMVLETTFSTPSGTVAITDALAMGEGNRGHKLGNDAPHLLLRRAICIEGEVELSLEYVLCPGYGQRLSPPRGCRRWSVRVRGCRRAGPLFSTPSHHRPVGRHGPAPAPPRRKCRLRLALRKCGRRDRRQPGSGANPR